VVGGVDCSELVAATLVDALPVLELPPVLADASPLLPTPADCPKAGTVATASAADRATDKAAVAKRPPAARLFAKARMVPRPPACCGG
jgi:hypothetical protein